MDAPAELLRRLPKVELHCHVEGSIRPTTVVDLARKHGVPLPVADPVELFQFTDLTQFLEVYGVVCSVLRTTDDFHRLAYEALEDGAAAGVRYREMFFSPGFVLRLGVPLGVVWEGLWGGVTDAMADLDIACRLILDVDKPSGPQHAMEMVAFAATRDRDQLLGVGGDANEQGVDHRAFAPAFDEAKRLGLRRTFHAGEDGPVDNIRIAIEDLGCERVDHGMRLLDDPELTKRVVDEQIPMTSCPNSNVHLTHLVPTLGEHPFARQRELGVLATLNSDDPGMMGTDLADEYIDVSAAMGLGLEQMEQIALDGITASFAPDDERVALRARFESEFSALRAEFGLPERVASAR